MRKIFAKTRKVFVKCQCEIRENIKEKEEHIKRVLKCKMPHL